MHCVVGQMQLETIRDQTFQIIPRVNPQPHVHTCVRAQRRVTCQQYRSGLKAFPKKKEKEKIQEREEGKMRGGEMHREASETNHIAEDFTVQPHPAPAFTSGLLKMISAHGGQALAFAFYWKH